MAKRRKTVGYSDADSGLECRFLLKWCEWEQKFISGIDPHNCMARYNCNGAKVWYIKE
jgi:hypothetical protein